MFTVSGLRFLRFLMGRRRAAPLAEFLHGEFALHFADVFSRPVIVALADRTLQAH